jgi:SAM-dependent methyltransferase
VTEREARVRTQYETWLRGRGPVSLYVRWYLRHDGPRYAAPLFSAMGPGPFPRVLDVGCATGFYLLWAFQHGHGRELLAGTDITPMMLDEARARLAPARAAGLDVVLREGSATALPFPDGCFDALVCNGVVKYLDDAMFAAFLADAMRVLVPGGAVALADFGRAVPEYAGRRLAERYGVPVDALRSERVLCEALDRAGFSDVRGVPLRRIRRLPLSYEGAAGTRP